MSRIDILRKSLDKKKAAFDDAIQNHFESVKSANGQPLNDKRGGFAKMNEWERQNSAIRNISESIKLSENAICKEELKQSGICEVASILPEHAVKLIEEGVIRQWGKFPHILFVEGVEKARIYFDKETGKFLVKYANQIKNKEQFEKFKDVFYKLKGV